MSTSEKYFSWNDAWVITAIMWSTEKEGPIDLSQIIGAGDMLNHAIFTEDELKSGFYKAQKKGLITISEKRLILLPIGTIIRNKICEGKGGLFTIIGRMEKKLNSKRTKLKEINENDIDPCDFINEKSMNESFKKYQKRFNQSSFEE